jgi:hypothetical protein
MSTTHSLISDEIPDRPQVDRRWSADDFAGHLAAEGIECHASPRFGGPPILAVSLVVVVAKAVLEVEREVIDDG